MPIDNGIVAVNTDITLIYTGRGIGDVPLSQKRPAILIKNLGSVDLYLGGPDVTADTTAATGGYTVAAGKEVSIGELASDDKLYGRTASSSVNVAVLEKF